MNKTMYRQAALFAAAGSACLFGAETRPAPVQKIEVSVERKQRDKVEMMDPNHVFEQGELVRFRFRSNFNGYLYVVDSSTSGKYLLLFPKQETGLDNQIVKNKGYLLPMTESGWFRVEGPAGHEILYWLVSPAKLHDDSRSLRPAPKLPTEAAPSSELMTPRCDDAIFKARGECIDVTAGIKPVEKSEQLPESLAAMADAQKRELTVTKSDKKTAVIGPAGDDAPFIYTFHLAHK